MSAVSWAPDGMWVLGACVGLGTEAICPWVLGENVHFPPWDWLGVGIYGSETPVLLGFRGEMRVYALDIP